MIVSGPVRRVDVIMIIIVRMIMSMTVVVVMMTVGVMTHGGPQ